MISLRTAGLYILSLHTYQPCPQDYSMLTMVMLEINAIQIKENHQK